MIGLIEVKTKIELTGKLEEFVMIVQCIQFFCSVQSSFRGGTRGAQISKGLPVGFLLLWYFVLFTVESLSWLYLLVLSCFICFER